MDIFLQQFVNGIIIGSTYVLMALGLTLIFGVLDIPDFSLGQRYMVGAFICYYAISLMRFNFWFSLILSMVLVFFISIVIERIVFAPLKDATLLVYFVAALGAGIVIQNIALLWWGEYTRIIPSPYSGKVISFLGCSLTVQRLLIFLVAVALIILINLFIKKTKPGKAMRAVGQDKMASEMMGINIRRISSMTFAIGSSLAAAAGSLMGPIFAVSPSMGHLEVLKAFVIIILGGMGSIPGAIFGGFILGVAESLGASYISSLYKDLIPFAVLVIILSLKPEGLFTKRS